MQEVYSSNPLVVTRTYDPNKSWARHHRSLKLGMKLKHFNNGMIMSSILKLINNTDFKSALATASIINRNVTAAESLMGLLFLRPLVFPSRGSRTWALNSCKIDQADFKDQISFLLSNLMRKRTCLWITYSR